jgi:hypothetical protein
MVGNDQNYLRGVYLKYSCGSRAMDARCSATIDALACRASFRTPSTIKKRHPSKRHLTMSTDSTKASSITSVPITPLRTYVSCDDGKTYLIDTIQYQGEFWLVPKWIATTSPTVRKPARIIRLPMERVQDLGHDFLGSDVRARKLDGLVPKAVLDGESGSQSDASLDVVEAPDLEVRK